MHSPPGPVHWTTTGCLSCSDLGGAQNAQPIWVCALVEHLRTWEVHEMQGSLGTVPLLSTLETEQCRPRKHTLLWAMANQVWSIHCEHSLHMQCYLFAVFLPPHKTTE